MTTSEPTAEVVIPAQLEIRIDFFDGGISIEQTGGPGGDESIWIAGPRNLDALIAALQAARLKFSAGEA